MDLQVTCVSKTGATHETITQLGGPSFGPWSKADVINAILTQQHTFYTRDAVGRADVRVVDGTYGKYLQTFADGRYTNNLLALGSCR